MTSWRYVIYMVAALACCSSCTTRHVERDFAQLRKDFYQDALVSLEEMTNRKGIEVEGARDGMVPADFQPWWEKDYRKQLSSDKKAQYLELDELIALSLTNAFQIRSFANIPLIRETTIGEAQGAFETRLFVEARDSSVHEPVGSTLRTGGDSVFEEDSFYLEGGIRKKLRSGGHLELAQQIGRVDNNSIYFSPTNQAHARLSLKFTQPLLYGAGCQFNESQIVLAKIDSQVGLSELRRQSESFLLELCHAYWSFYLERVYLMQKQRLLLNAQGILEKMKERQDVDVLRAHISRTQAEYSTVAAELVRAEVALRNAEARLRSLVNAPMLYRPDEMEFIPLPESKKPFARADLKQSIRTAILNRPELEELVHQRQAAGVRERVAKNQLLPTLNVIAEGYLAGLAGDYDTDEAIDVQMDMDPSYVVGLVFEMPWSRKSARNRYQRRKLEVRQLSDKLRATAETIVLDVQVSAREVEASYREAQGRYQAMVASQEEYADMVKRQSLVFDGGERASDYLERLLNSQRRLTSAEGNYARSMVTYQLALLNLRRATGTLLAAQQIELRESDEDGLPVIRLEINRSNPPNTQQ